MSRSASFIFAVSVISLLAGHSLSGQSGPPPCTAAQPKALLPSDPGRCEALAAAIRNPGGMPLDEYQKTLGEFLGDFCHRDTARGWVHDKRVRDVGPYVARLDDGKWIGTPHGTHAPVVIWYSPEMVKWMTENRPSDEAKRPSKEAPVPDGAIIVKEMYPAPASACRDVELDHLLPTSGAAVMVRDRDASADGWFWGWFGWSGWTPDWPAAAGNRYPYMGFGQYCVNCHASAKDNLTFSSLRNVAGHPGQPIVFLSQGFFDTPGEPGHHRLVTLPGDDDPRLGEPHYAYVPSFLRHFAAAPLGKPSWESVSKMPSQTYDNVWAGAGGATAADTFVTSDQCVGCHDAGGTGLQFDMTTPNPHGDDLLNHSPYATWRTSPMGLGGRDPIFFAQLASETQSFHPKSAELVESTCLGCHGIQGQRQYIIDGGSDPACGSGKKNARCFDRTFANATPWPDDNPLARLSRYGALARDGISCMACHRMLVGKGDGAALDRPENTGVRERMAFLNPENEGFARTFTGSYLVGPPDELYGPFADPKTKPMDHALGMRPVHDESIRNSELCGSCHTVHLPVMNAGKVIGYTYEQTTYPEWAFSEYRTGVTPDGKLPGGAGSRAQSCQDCHMPAKDADGKPYRSKIAGIQEYSNFPQADNNLGPEDIDLPVREGFARHTLVGLNVFLVKMAQQFPDVLGIRTQDPMLVSKGQDPLVTTEQAMLDQASNDTAKVSVEKVETSDGELVATVHVENYVGHKFPSGVGFRRAFLAFEVMNSLGEVIWASGRTNDVGVLVDENGKPLAGERWWTPDCSARIAPGKTPHQPHYQRITKQDEAQIYQELVASPAPGAKAHCGAAATPGGSLTTSFLSICRHVKDNRLLPHGFLPLDERVEIAKALGAGEDLAEDSGPFAVEGDPDYVSGGGDRVVYAVPLSDLKGSPVSVRATLYYQATPPFYLEDRFCTGRGDDTERLYFLSGHLNLDGTAAEDWKLEIDGSGPVPVR